MKVINIAKPDSRGNAFVELEMDNKVYVFTFYQNPDELEAYRLLDNAKGVVAAFVMKKLFESYENLEKLKL